MLKTNSPYNHYDFISEVNKFNINKIIPDLKMIPKDFFETFLLVEHNFITRQLRLIEILLRSKLKFDEIDGCLIVASITRTIIENIAVLNYLIYDNKDNITREEKIKVLEEFHNSAASWKKKNKRGFKDNIHAYNVFIQEHKSVINKHIWAKISPDINTTSKLIKSLKTPLNWTNIGHNTKPYGEAIYEEWDNISKLLHNNQLHRLALIDASGDSISLNLNNYQMFMESALSALGLLFLNHLHCLLEIINNEQITNKYEEFLKKNSIKSLFLKNSLKCN